MALTYENDFTTSFAGVTNMQSLGTITDGDSSPSGISTGISIGSFFGRTCYRARVTDADATTASGQRSEIVFADAAVGDSEFFDFEIYVDRDDWTASVGSPDRMVIHQVHNEDTIVAAVDYLLWIESGSLVIWHPSTEPPAEGATYISRMLCPFPFDAWTRITVHVRWDAAATGFIDVYVNGRRLYGFISRGTAYTSDTPYGKLGIYASAATGFGTKDAYYSNFAHYRDTDGVFQDWTTVMGDVPLRAAQLLV